MGQPAIAEAPGPNFDSGQPHHGREAVNAEEDRAMGPVETMGSDDNIVDLNKFRQRFNPSGLKALSPEMALKSFEILSSAGLPPEQAQAFVEALDGLRAEAMRPLQAEQHLTKAGFSKLLANELVYVMLTAELAA